MRFPQGRAVPQLYVLRLGGEHHVARYTWRAGPLLLGMYSMLFRERNCCVFFDRYTAVSESITSCFMGPWIPHHESIAAMMESSSLSDITTVCNQRIHTQTIAKTILSYVKKRSPSTFPTRQRKNFSSRPSRSSRCQAGTSKR